jgi:hypothetical protein
MIASLLKWKGGHDLGHPPMNNTTNAQKQRFGQNKFMAEMEVTYIDFLKDCKFVETAIQNPNNLPKDLPALVNLVNLLEKKYNHITAEPFVDVLQFHLNAIRQELSEMSIKFYKFYFSDQSKPVTIEAVSKQAAYHGLEQIMPNIEEHGYQIQNLVDVKVESPIVGVSKKKHKGKTFIWTPEGWLEHNI